MTTLQILILSALSVEEFHLIKENQEMSDLCSEFTKNLAKQKTTKRSFENLVKEELVKKVGEGYAITQKGEESISHNPELLPNKSLGIVFNKTINESLKRETLSETLTFMYDKNLNSLNNHVYDELVRRGTIVEPTVQYQAMQEPTGEAIEEFIQNVEADKDAQEAVTKPKKAKK